MLRKIMAFIFIFCFVLCTGSSLRADTWTINSNVTINSNETHDIIFVGLNGAGSVDHGSPYTVTAKDLFYHGHGTDPSSNGTYYLRDGGSIHVGAGDGYAYTYAYSYQSIGIQSTATFYQLGGSNYSEHQLVIGHAAGSDGKYYQSAGSLETGYHLYLGLTSGATGAYYLSGTGTLQTTTINLGNSANGTIVQSGGTINAKNMVIGRYSTAVGSYTISGGSITTTGSIEIGKDGIGSMTITNSAADISIASLIIGVNSTFSTVANSEITITGQTGNAFSVAGTNDSTLAGLNNLTLTLDGNQTEFIALEAAGDDSLGLTAEGFVENFALDTLILGGSSGIAQAMLIDNYDNQTGTDAFYVDTLILNDDSILDLNGLNLYCNTFINYGGTITGGGNLFAATSNTIPEPATLLLFGIALSGILRKIKH